MRLSGRHRKTLAAIFEEPTRADVTWTSIERLIKALGAEITEGRGSRMRFHLSGVRALFHRPHRRKECDRGALRSVRRLLTSAGVEPKE